MPRALDSTDPLISRYLAARASGTTEEALTVAWQLAVAFDPRAADPLATALGHEAVGQRAVANGDTRVAVDAFDAAAVAFWRLGRDVDARWAEVQRSAVLAEDPETGIHDVVAHSESLAGALNALRDAGADDPVLLDTSLALAMALMRRQQLDRAEQLIDEAARHATLTHQQARIAGARALLAAQLGDMDAASSYAAAALGLAEQSGDGVQQAYLRMFLAGQAGMAGDLDQAAALIDKVHFATGPLGRPIQLAVRRLRASIRLALGDRVSAEADLSIAARIAGTAAERAEIAGALVAVAGTYLSADDALGAALLLERVAEAFDDLPDDTAIEVGKARFAAYSESGQVAKAAAALEAAAPAMTRTHHHEAHSAWELAARLFDQVGDLAAAERVRDAARDVP